MDTGLPTARDNWRGVWARGERVFDREALHLFIPPPTSPLVTVSMGCFPPHRQMPQLDRKSRWMVHQSSSFDVESNDLISVVFDLVLRPALVCNSSSAFTSQTALLPLTRTSLLYGSILSRARFRLPNTPQSAPPPLIFCSHSTAILVNAFGRRGRCSREQ